VLPAGQYFINPRRPDRTAVQFLDWYGKQGCREPLTRKSMHAAIYNFLDTAAWWKTSIRGPERGTRDHLIMSFVPGTRDINRVAQALRQAF
jgi:hypothetical protein